MPGEIPDWLDRRTLEWCAEQCGMVANRAMQYRPGAVTCERQLRAAARGSAVRDPAAPRSYTLTITREQVGSGRVVTHSQTTLDLPPADAMRVRDAVRSGLPPGFSAELTGPDCAAIKLADLFRKIEVTE